MIDPSDRRRAGPSRREFIALGVGAFAVAALPRVLKPERTLVRSTRPVMGTLAEVAVVARDRRRARGAIDAAMAELVRVERVMTRFRPDSEVGRVNGAPVGEPVAVSAETAAVVTAALEWADVSGGGFDPALGGASALWSVESRVEPPAAGEVGRFASRSLWRAIEVDRFRGRPAIVRRDPDAAIDLGGIAKGHGVDRAAAVLREWGVTRGMVNVGGDLYALGDSIDGDPWEVGIRDPSRPDGLAGTVALADRAVATSGDYEQFFEWKGRRYHHLLDPRTGAPKASPFHGVTAIADRVVTADAAGTAAFGIEPGRAARMVARIDPRAELRFA